MENNWITCGSNVPYLAFLILSVTIKIINTEILFIIITLLSINIYHGTATSHWIASYT